ncbi:MAG TPA: penicillin acylase family protein, partial [Casimicrobiaceae bacterium]
MGRRVVLACLIALVGAAPAAAEPSAVIRRTAHGIPHIQARDWEGLGYGYGYAFAEDNLCEIADAYVTVDAQRSRFFGPDKTYPFRANSTNPNNLNSDFFYQRIKDAQTVEKLMAQAPPLGPRPEVKEAVHGYVEGYNEYLRRTGVDKLPDPRCRGAAWVRPIDDMDAYRRFYQLALLASAGVAIDGIGGATPPPAGASGGADAALRAFGREPASAFDEFPLGGIGSNAVALGKAATDNGHGALLGNPHFPWDGTERFYQAQLTIPGKLNVSGGSLFGVPIVLIGHTPTLAWSHTVSTAFRFTPFEEKLVPGSPTTYLVDGQPRPMKAEKVTVPVQGGETRTRTLYSTDHGPILTSILGLPIFPWTPERAYAMGDANASNFRYLNHFFEINQAKSVGDVDTILKRNQGIPWVNTIAADDAGKAYYADISVVPNVPDAKTQQCAVPLGVATDKLLRLPVLDGSRAACNWDNDPDAVQKGIFGPSHMPTLTRDDYTSNMNDSYWLANPHQPITGYARIIGDEATARSLRTRSGLTMIEERLKGGGRFALADIQALLNVNRQYAGELFRDDLVRLCESSPVEIGSSGPVDVSAACPVLKAWDGHDDLDSRGAVLFRRFVTRALAAQGGPFREPFDAADPVNTPRGLNTDNPQVRQALADAVTDLRSANIPLDARLREYQYEKRGDERIPIPGGPGTLGVFNAINVTWVPGQGYPDVPHGSSFIQAVRFTGSGCPDVRTILSYSESTNPTSPYFADQTKLFSNEQWVKAAFCERDIAAGTIRTERLGPPAAGLVGGGSRCVSRRALKLRLRVPRGTRLRSVVVRVTGRKATTLRGRRVRARRVTVSLRGL